MESRKQTTMKLYYKNKQTGKKYYFDLTYGSLIKLWFTGFVNFLGVLFLLASLGLMVYFMIKVI